MTDQEQFINWMRTAQPNDKYAYYTGSSLTDTLISNEIRKFIWSHACRGYVYLVQKKERVHYYHFIAIKASKIPNARLVPLSERKEVSNFRRYTTKTKLKPEHIEVSTHG